MKPKIIVFASGSNESGGSGFENLVIASRSGPLNAEIIAVVSNHANGGVRNRADRLKIPFLYFSKPYTDVAYQRLASESQADFFVLSGWLKLVAGLDLATRFNSRTIFNIHPGPLPNFGGPGLYGHHVHEAVIDAYERGEISRSAICMHFVTEKYDQGPVFFRCSVPIIEGDTPKTLGIRVNQFERKYQPEITNMVVNGLIKWDGVNSSSLELPQNYLIEQQA